MPDKLQTRDIVARLAERMNVGEKEAAACLDAVIETIYDAIAAGENVTLKGFGKFYVQPKQDEWETWVFKFSPAQRLRAALGWASTYRGK